MGGVATIILSLCHATLTKIPNHILHPITFLEEENLRYGLVSGAEATISALLCLLAFTKYTDNPVNLVGAAVRTMTEISMGLLMLDALPGRPTLIWSSTKLATSCFGTRSSASPQQSWSVSWRESHCLTGSMTGS